jgi:hypothetical protein
MAQITIEVPEALAQQLAVVKDQLPDILAREFRSSPPLSNEVYRYILKFLATTPSEEAILNFRLTSAMQERAAELLERNRADQLTSTEATELDEYMYINDLVSLLKARALTNIHLPGRRGA